MPRRSRIASGGYVYHVLNRGVGRMTIFDHDDDYAAFERVMTQAAQRVTGARLLAYCLMSNHWHLLLWPRGDTDLSEYMRWLTVTHTQRWHAHRRSAGTGPIYQGRYKSFPVASDEHMLTAARYVERNALRAGLVNRAEDWRWGSLWRWVHRRRPMAHSESLPELHPWPIERSRSWTRLVNRPQTEAELDAVRRCVVRGAPLGSARWVERTARRLSLESALRPIGRPRGREEVT